MADIKINTGTGPGIAVDYAGTSNYQVVKIMQAVDSATAGLQSYLVVSQTGTSDVAVTNTVAISGTASAVIVGNVPVYAAKPTTQIQGLLVSTTSAAGIVITSGAHTIYLTDLLVSVNVPMTVSLRSATTEISTVYLATNGGYVHPMRTPMVLNTAQSLTVLQSASGSCSVYAAGYTVT